MRLTEPCHKIVNKVCCGTCEYYRQHFVWDKGGRPASLWYGHCVYSGTMGCAPDQSCSHYSPTVPGLISPESSRDKD